MAKIDYAMSEARVLLAQEYTSANTTDADVRLLANDLIEVAREFDGTIDEASKILMRRIRPASLDSYMRTLRVGS